MAQLVATRRPSQERAQPLSPRWVAERPPEDLIVESPNFQRMKARLARLPPAQPMPLDPPQSPRR